MNKLRLVLVGVLLLPLSLFSQKARVEFSFSMQQSGSQLAVDSVVIENLTARCDTTIYPPNYSFRVSMLASIHESLADDDFLRIENWFVNTADNSVEMSVYTPDNKVLVEIFDTNGRLLHSENFAVMCGYNTFKLHGVSKKCVVNFLCKGREASLLVVNVNDTNTKLRIDYVGGSQRVMAKSLFSSDKFIFHQGDEMRFTMYSTSCFDVVSREIVDNPIETSSYVFDFSDITAIRPEKVGSYEKMCSMSQIRWNWQPDDNADGYKYNLVNDYETATDIGNVTEIVYPMPLDSGTNYRVYLWAYNNCGVSDVIVLLGETPATNILPTEYEIATLDTSLLPILNIFDQPDSVILRTKSKNVVPTDTIWHFLANRMYLAGKVSGVGIAAPQVGINRNIVCLQRYDKPSGSGFTVSYPWEFYYNPQIIEYCDTLVRRSDGCLSVPDNSDFPEITDFSYRAKWVKVAYYDSEGVYHEEKITHQYTAHIFQHEIDHLNAIMYFDRNEQDNEQPIMKIER